LELRAYRGVANETLLIFKCVSCIAILSYTSTNTNKITDAVIVVAVSYLFKNVRRSLIPKKIIGNSEVLDPAFIRETSISGVIHDES